MGTKTIGRTALMAQDETAVKHKHQYNPARKDGWMRKIHVTFKQANYLIDRIPLKQRGKGPFQQLFNTGPSY